MPWAIHIAFHDAAENVDKYRFQIRILEHDFEGLGHLLGGGTAAHIEKVGGTSTIKLGDVHGRHRQTCAVDQTSNVAIERNVIEIEFRGLDFRRVFFVEIAHRDDIRMAEERVIVEVHLGVERDDAAGARQHEWIHLGERRIAFIKSLVESLEHGAGRAQ
jgi:hypothetical protein